MNPTSRLHDRGQRVWLDSITRRLLDDGSLRHYIEDYAVSGLNSNPTLFAAAIAHDGAHAAALRARAQHSGGAQALTSMLVQHDLRRAARLLLPIFTTSGGADGWVSMAIAPVFANDAGASLAAALALRTAADYPNLLVKIPGTAAGLVAIEAALFAGVPVNVTLLFSLAQYRAASNAWLSALERRLAAGLSPRVGAVASIFVSRWDVAVRGRVSALLEGRLGIAVAETIYHAHCELLASARWQRLAEAGADIQRLSWASTGVEDAAASPTRYVEALVAPGTINTMPEATLLAYAADGMSARNMPTDGVHGRALVMRYARAGLDIDSLGTDLQRAGVRACVMAWQALLGNITRLARSSA